MIITISIQRSQATLRPTGQRVNAPMTISSDLWTKFSKMQILTSCRTRTLQTPTANAQYRSKSRQITTISTRCAFTSAAAMSSSLRLASGSECVLAYRFSHKAEPAPTAGEIAARIETWLAKNFGVNLEFKIAHALETLNRFGLVRRDGERLFVPPLEPAIAQLHQVWNNFFKR